MNNIDRTIAPASKPITNFVLPEVITKPLENSIPFHMLLTGTQPVVRLELLFKAGSWNEHTPGIAHFSAKMITEGTRNFSSNQIQEKFAAYGAFIEITPGLNNTTITVYSLAKHLNEITPLLFELITQATFPEEEFETTRNIYLQTLKVNNEKSSFVASHKFRETIFGESHPYGHFLNEPEVNALTTTLLKEFYSKNFNPSNCEIFLTGFGTNNFYEDINKIFGNTTWQKSNYVPDQKEFDVHKPFTKRTWVPKEDAVQSSIRMGKKLFTMSHPDYFSMLFLNEIFGGYFGSRLMQNIREEKGYTYGIHSSVVTLQQDGYFVIGTDVKKEVTENTIEEIYKEILRLKTEPVDATEMETVRNYMLGTFINSIATPFAMADKFKTVHLNGLDYRFYQNYFKAIQTITAENIQETAVKYLDEHSINEVIVGDPKLG